MCARERVALLCFALLLREALKLRGGGMVESLRA
jgi:hypothetical protein